MLSLDTCNVISIDYETTGFNCYKSDRIFAYVATNWDLESKVYRFDNISPVKNAVADIEFTKYHKPEIIKVAHNAKFEMGFTSMYFDGELPKSVWYCTYIMSKMLKNLLPKHSLEILSKRYFSDVCAEECERWEYYDKEVKKHLTKQKRLLNNYPKRFEPEILQPLWDNGIKPFITDRPNYGLVPVDIMKGYQISDGERGMLLFRLMFPKIKKDEKMWLDYLNEMRLIRTVQKMEQIGMMLHLSNAEDLIHDLSKKVESLTKKKKRIFGFDINIDSSDQLQKHLFGHVNKKKHENINQEWKRHDPVFNMLPINTTAGGAPSTSKDDLLELQKKYPKNAALDTILQYRAFSKGKTIIYSYIEAAGDNLSIHPTTNTNEARTGRQSVSSPNLQNVNKEFSVNTVYGIPARRCLRPRPGYVYFPADYSGIEMRLIIGASGEVYLIDKLNEDMDYDVHTDNAVIILDKEILFYLDGMIKRSDLTADEKKRFKEIRDDIKNATFGRCYGAGINTFAKAIRKSVIDAQDGWERLARERPHLFFFCKNMSKEVEKYGYITTAFGRRLYVDTRMSYFAANYRIQGDAAGILKRAQNNVDDYIQVVRNGDYDLLRMLLTVHDEIIFEVHRSLLPQKYDILHDLSYCMTDMPQIQVPLAVDWKISTTNWQDAKGIEI